MEKLENIFKNYKGLVVFYLVVAVLALMLTKKVDNINSQAEKLVKEKTSYYA